VINLQGVLIKMMWRERIIYLGTITLAYSLSACQPQAVQPAYRGLVAVLHPTEGGDVSGIVHFTGTGRENPAHPQEVQVDARVEGLPSHSRHGFHIHEFGDCSAADATSAGDHYNPFDKKHGDRRDDERHVGDMGNLESDDRGVAVLRYSDPIMPLSGEGSIVGRSVIVHEGEDDLQTQPSGDAGPRAACGVIGVAQE
jgi:superoxide dismutase, Cu-Zn family